MPEGLTITGSTTTAGGCEYTVVLNWPHRLAAIRATARGSRRPALIRIPNCPFKVFFSAAFDSSSFDRLLIAPFQLRLPGYSSGCIPLGVRRQTHLPQRWLSCQ